MAAFLKPCFLRRSTKMATFGKKKRGIALALSKRKPSKQKQQQRREMEERFKRLKAEKGLTGINIKQRSCSSNVGPKKGRRSSLFEVGAKLEKLQEEVAGKLAETRILKQQLIEGETKVEASLQKISQLRMVHALLFLENIRDEGLVNHVTCRILG